MGTVTASDITDEEILELHARGGIDADTAHVALHGWPDERAAARGRCAAARARAAEPYPGCRGCGDDPHEGDCRFHTCRQCGQDCAESGCSLHPRAGVYTTRRPQPGPRHVPEPR